MKQTNDSIVSLKLITYLKRMMKVSGFEDVEVGNQMVDEIGNQMVEASNVLANWSNPNQDESDPSFSCILLHFFSFTMMENRIHM